LEKRNGHRAKGGKSGKYGPESNRKPLLVILDTIGEPYGQSFRKENPWQGHDAVDGADEVKNPHENTAKKKKLRVSGMRKDG